jgi:ArsR family transcriptional regulator
MAEVSRTELFRLFGDEDRLRLLALCAEEELAVGELATLLGESQPQVTRKSQPLREAGLLAARRDGTRTFLSTVAGAADAASVIVAAAVEEGRLLCAKDGALARVPAIVRAREEESRRFFDAAAAETPPPPSPDGADVALSFLPALSPLLPGRALAVDVGAGEGTLLPLLSALYDRVVALDRSAGRLARCAARVAAFSLGNVRLREADVDDAAVVAEIDKLGGADLVLCARILHHAARPGDLVRACGRLTRTPSADDPADRGGAVVIVDYLPHDDEGRRDRGDVWLGFPPERLRGFLEEAGLVLAHAGPLALRLPADEDDRHLPFQIAVAHRPPRPLP